jgi:HK97 family phage prohead protease
VDFKLYTNALKAYEAENGDLRVRGTTSSTIVDMHGDEMTLAALKSMEETAKQNMTVFLNHNYNVPDDLFGSVTDATIVKRFDRETNQDVYDLDIDVRVVGEDENPLAMKTYRAIKRGVKLGLSIGARVEKVGKRKGEDGKESYVIDNVRLLEASVVGIPANQRSYLQSALKSLRSPETKADGARFKVGDYVRWNSSGGPAEGAIERVVTEGSINVPNSSVVINAEEGDPAVLIRVWQGSKPSDVRVGHKMSTLREATRPTAEEKSETEVSSKAEAGSVIAGDWVLWSNEDGETMCGAVEYVMTEGTLGAEGAEYSIEATPEDPAALVRIYEGEEGNWEATEMLVGQKVSALTKVNPLPMAEEDEETEMSETEKALVAGEVVETAAGDETIDLEKKTRVTVTVSTDGDSSAVSAKPAEQAAPEAAAEKAEETAPEAILASAEKDCTCAEGECTCEAEVSPAIATLQDLGAELVTEKAFEPTPTPAPEPTPAPAPEATPEPAPAPSPVEEPQAPVADGNQSSRYKSGVSDQVLVGINGILADLTDEDRDAVLAGLGVQKDGEPVVEEAPISDTEVTLEVVQEAPAEVAAEAASDVVAEDAAATSLEEVAAIAKSALDAALAAQQEVVSFKKELTELVADKAKVEGELAKALDVVGRMINVPMGRKHVGVETTKSTNGEKAPWLDPFIARLLDAQE